MRWNKFLLLAALALLLLWGVFSQALSFNLAASRAMAIFMAGVGPDEDVETALANLASSHCRAAWYQGFLDQQEGHLSPANNAWAEAIRCDAALIVYLHLLVPEAEAWAVESTQAQPESAEAWFWLGDLQPDNRLVYYQKGLELDPMDGRRWIVLGDMLQPDDPQAAIEAYLQGCYHGDPGYNGCLRAGSVAEQLGDFENALRYYHLSAWEGSHQRADQLEARMNQPSP